MDPNAPIDPIDLSKILLPKKEGPSTASAERVNAGVLLEQEQIAAAPTPSTIEPPAVPTPKPAAGGSPVKQLETYQGDIESVVQKNDVSVVSIAAAEANRRAQEIQGAPVRDEGGAGKRIVLMALGVLLIAGALGVLSWAYLRPATSVPVATVGAAPFISVDDTEQVVLEPSDTSQEVMRRLEAAKDSITLSLGLVAQVVVTLASSTSAAPTLVSAPQLLSALSPYVPSELLRTLSPTYLLGVHSYDENEAFLILQADDYSTAYAGMLQWETTMMQDLSPLFVRNPTQQLSAGSGVQTSGTSTTNAASSVTGVPSNFVDQVVDNHDARVLLDSQGNIVLLWTFIDRQTLVVTNNEATLREIISRLATPAVQALPR